MSRAQPRGPARAGGHPVAGCANLADLEEIDASPVRCLDGEAEERMAAAVDAAKAAGDTLGRVFEVVAHGLPPASRSYVHWDRKLDARLAGALMSIQAIKGRGRRRLRHRRPSRSRAHDAIVPGARPGTLRAADRAGRGSRAACRPARPCGCGRP